MFGKCIRGGSGIIGSLLFIIPFIFFWVIHYSLFSFARYSLFRCLFFYRNRIILYSECQTLNIPYSFYFRSRHSLFRFHPRKCNFNWKNLKTTLHVWHRFDFPIWYNNKWNVCKAQNYNRILSVWIRPGCKITNHIHLRFPCTSLLQP